MMRIMRRGARRAQWRGDLPAGLPTPIIEEIREMASDAIEVFDSIQTRRDPRRERDRVLARYGYLLF